MWLENLGVQSEPIWATCENEAHGVVRESEQLWTECFVYVGHVTFLFLI
jgi:hypothetical protein